MAAMPREECARRLGDSPSKRMSASWSRFRVSLTEYKVAVRHSTPKGELPPEYYRNDRESRRTRRSCSRSAEERTKENAYEKRLTLESPYKAFPLNSLIHSTRVIDFARFTTKRDACPRHVGLEFRQE